MEGDLSAVVTDLPHPVFEGRHVGAEGQAEIPQHEVGRCSHNRTDFLVALKGLEGATDLQAFYFHLARWIHGFDQLLYLWGGAGRKELDDVLGQHSSGGKFASELGVAGGDIVNGKRTPECYIFRVNFEAMDIQVIILKG